MFSWGFYFRECLLTVSPGKLAWISEFADPCMIMTWLDRISKFSWICCTFSVELHKQLYTSWGGTDWKKLQVIIAACQSVGKMAAEWSDNIGKMLTQCTGTSCTHVNKNATFVTAPCQEIHFSDTILSFTTTTINHWECSTVIAPGEASFAADLWTKCDRILFFR
jgi:hypothetical protein